MKETTFSRVGGFGEKTVHPCCDRCGALVGDVEKHKRWHAAEDRFSAAIASWAHAEVERLS